jgi:hypothetical protein
MSDQSRRPRDTASGGAPMGSTAAIIIAIVAVVVGFVILRQINSDDGEAGGGVSSNTTVASSTSAPATIPLPTEPPTTPVTIPVDTKEGAVVIVANASTVNGAAGILSTALNGAGFTVGTASNASAKQEISTVHYDASNPTAQAVAETVARLMGVTEVTELPAPAPIEGGVLPDSGTVLVLLGGDKANVTLANMTAPTTTVPGGTTTTTAA